MKYKLLLPLIFPAMLLCGCLGKNDNNATPTVVPTGNFTGYFKLTHTNSKTGAIDTATANLNLSLSTATGYKVTGDTSTLHAGSYGILQLKTAAMTIQFADVTYPATGIPAKKHLNGIYSYTYNGTNLQMIAYGPKDTLSFFYNFKKTN